MQSCDMWSLGVVIYIMLCGYPPFYSEVPRKQLSQGMRRRIMAGDYDYPDKEWSKISAEAKEVIARYSVFLFSSLLEHQSLIFSHSSRHYCDVIIA